MHWRRQHVPQRAWALVLIGSAWAAPLAAQVRYETANTRVEILGLERWSRRMLEDSIAHYVPGATVESAACMAILRYKLHFRDALVMHYRGFDGPASTREFLSVRVVEPSRIAGSAWRALPAHAYPSLLSEYAPLILPATDSAGDLWPSRILHGLDLPDSLARMRVLARANPAMREDFERARAFLDSHHGDRDWQLALRVLDSSSAYGNRMTAALVLSSFPERDRSWYALLAALRDPHEAVRSAAATAIAHMPTRPIDWAPATADLRALLGGTNLSAMEPVMALLVQTRVSSTLVRPLLRGNDQWLMRLLTANAPMAASNAKSLLVALAGGKDLGNDPGPWRMWITSQ